MSRDSATLDIASAFDKLGFNLIMGKRSDSELSAEEAIIGSFIHPEERLQTGIPVLLALNPIQYSKLRELIDHHSLWNAFGYFGEFTLQHDKEYQLQDLVSYCMSKLTSCYNISSLPAEYFPHQTPQEQKWNIVGAPSYNALERQFQRYLSD